MRRDRLRLKASAGVRLSAARSSLALAAIAATSSTSTRRARSAPARQVVGSSSRCRAFLRARSRVDPETGDDRTRKRPSSHSSQQGVSASRTESNVRVCTRFHRTSKNLCKAAGNPLKNASLIHSLLSLVRQCGALFDACSASITITPFVLNRASCFCSVATAATRPAAGKSIPGTRLPNVAFRRLASGPTPAAKSPKPR